MKNNILYNLIEDQYLKDKNIFKKLDLIKNRLTKKKIKLNCLSELGSGMYGTAYQINDKTVLKITEDYSEAKAMKIVKAFPNKNIVKVYDVFSCFFGRRKFNFIIQEKLNEADDSWRHFSNHAFNDDYACDYITPKLIKISKNIPNYWIQNQKQYETQWKWLNNLAFYFKKHNIKFADLHSENILKRKKNHVLIDLGCSKSPKQKIYNIKL